MNIKTAQERLLELYTDSFNAPASMVVACQNDEIVELRNVINDMKTIYVVMNTIDLGGEPVMSYYSNAKAKLAATELNVVYKDTKIKDLMNIGYSDGEAEHWCITNNTAGQYYVRPICVE